MKYTPPIGSLDQNEHYVDANPAVGIQGSAVPAASIEYPQREIVNAIISAGLTPSNNDLSQLVEAIKKLSRNLPEGILNSFLIGNGSGSYILKTPVEVKTLLEIPTNIADDTKVVHIEGNETIDGSKVFVKSPIVSGDSVSFKLHSLSGSNPYIQILKENVGGFTLISNSERSEASFRTLDALNDVSVTFKTQDVTSNSNAGATTKFVNDFLELKKGNIVDWGMPDYTSYITLGLGNQTAQYSGLLMVTPDARLGQSKFAINIGSKIYYPYQAVNGSDYEHATFFYLPIKKGIPFNITELSGCTAQFFRFIY